MFLVEAMTLLEEQAETLSWVAVAWVPQAMGNVISVEFDHPIKFQK